MHPSLLALYAMSGVALIVVLVGLYYFLQPQTPARIQEALEVGLGMVLAMMGLAIVLAVFA